MKKNEKPIFVENLTKELTMAKGFVLVNFAGMSVAAQQELKKRLREVGAELVVVKNTLFKRAGAAASLDAEALSEAILSGQTAIIIAKNDAFAPISTLAKFAKEFDSGAGYSIPNMKVGIIEGKFYDHESLTKISTLPSREVLLSQLMGTLMGAEYGLVGTLKGNLSKLVYILETKVKGER